MLCGGVLAAPTASEKQDQHRPKSSLLSGSSSESLSLGMTCLEECISEAEITFSQMMHVEDSLLNSSSAENPSIRTEAPAICSVLAYFEEQSDRLLPEGFIEQPRLQMIRRALILDIAFIYPFTTVSELIMSSRYWIVACFARLYFAASLVSNTSGITVSVRFGRASIWFRRRSIVNPSNFLSLSVACSGASDSDM